MKNLSLIIAFLVILAVPAFTFADDDESPAPCNPLTGACRPDPPICTSWIWIILDGTTDEICVTPDGDGG